MPNDDHAGVSIWLDDLSRERLTSGSLADRHHVAGVTTNPSVFANAIGTSTTYDEQLRDLGRGVDVAEAVRAWTTTYDVRWACDVWRPVHDATGALDG